MKKLFLILLLFLSFSLTAQPIDDMDTFYELVNDYRERIGVPVLDVDPALEAYSDYYNHLCLRNGNISHGLLPLEQIATKVDSLSQIRYDLIHEVLQSGPVKLLSDFVFVFHNFVESPSHNAALIREDGVTIGANYLVSENEIVIFSAYVGVLYE